MVFRRLCCRVVCRILLPVRENVEERSIHLKQRSLRQYGYSFQSLIYGSFEKVGSLPWTLPRNDEQITTSPGDIILYKGNQITIYYDTNSWSFTRLAKIGITSKEELLDVLGEGNVTVLLYAEWGE